MTAEYEIEVTVLTVVDADSQDAADDFATELGDKLDAAVVELVVHSPAGVMDVRYTLS